MEEPTPPSSTAPPCAGCAAAVATPFDAPGGTVWLCPACAAFEGLGCP